MNKAKMERSLIVFCAILLLTAGFSACTGGQKEDNKLYIYNWTYYMPDSVIEKFEKEYGVEVIYEPFASNEDMYAKIQSGGSGYDIIVPSGDYVSIMIKQNLFEKLDKTKLANLGNIDSAILAKATYDSAMDYSVPYYFGAAGIAVNTASVPDFERSWSIFGRSDLKNRMTMLDDMREVMGDALVYLGYSVNTKDSAQIEAAKDLINNSWKPNLTKFDAEAFGKGYANGDFWVVQGYAEVVYKEIKSNPQMMAQTVFFIPPEGGPSYIDSMCILKGAKHVDLAYKFIDFIHRPDIYAEFTDTFGFPSSVNIPARSLKQEAPYYTSEELENTEIKDDLGETLELYNKAWFDSIRVGD
ncbi:extracellular solute-binding protein [Breznakiellaceae bacterium SP9]